jgi:heme exporter protein A
MTAENLSETLLRSHNLRLDISQEPVLSGISVTLEKGKIIALTGPNGSGKTVFLEILAGKRTASDGHFELLPPLSKRDMLFLPQSVLIWPFITVERQLHRWAESSAMRLALPAVIEYLQLAYYLNAPWRRLSTGWQARVMLAQLMLRPRLIWLLDDRAAYLDETGRLMLKGLVAGHLRKGGGIIATGRNDASIKTWLPDDAPVQWLDAAQFLVSEPSGLDIA